MLVSILLRVSGARNVVVVMVVEEEQEETHEADKREEKEGSANSSIEVEGALFNGGAGD